MPKPQETIQPKRRRREREPMDNPETNAFLDSLLKGVKSPEDITGTGGLLDQLQARFINRALESEMTGHLGHENGDKPLENQENRRNGSTSKKLRSKSSAVKIQMPRDRFGTFEPALVPKHSRTLGRFEDTIIALYSRGMSVRDICRFMEESYGVEIERDVVSRATDAILDDIKQWQTRPLEATYLAVWLDALIIKSSEKGGVENRTVYIAVGLNNDGEKDVLGLWFQDTEGAKFWLQVLNELRDRGLRDILFLCADGLKGLPEAAQASFPKSIFQTCIVHVIRASTRYVPWKDRKSVCGQMREIYTAINLQTAEEALEEMDRLWGKKYPAMLKTWRSAWSEIVPFLAFPAELRKTIYTTNPIEGLNRIIRKATKTRGHFPSDKAAEKVIYLAINNAQKTWGKKPRNWLQMHAQFQIHFGDRVPPLS